MNPILVQLNHTRSISVARASQPFRMCKGSASVSMQYVQPIEAGGAPNKTPSSAHGGSLSSLKTLVGETRVPGNQVVLYFDKQEDALLFTLAASSIMSGHAQHSCDASAKVAEGVCKASRIKAEGVLNVTGRETITT